MRHVVFHLVIKIILSNGRRIKKVFILFENDFVWRGFFFIRSEMLSIFLLIFKLTDCQLSFLILDPEAIPKLNIKIKRFAAPGLEPTTF